MWDNITPLVALRFDTFCGDCEEYKKKYCASTQIPLGSCSDSICQVSRQLIENKKDLLYLIKPKWPPQARFQSHMKTDNTNRLADPENLYIYQV